MRFHKNVTKEEQIYLKEELARYEQEKPMTMDELKELNEWIASGNSPYTNSYGYCFENGFQMDFIEAMRICLVQCKERKIKS